MSRATDRDLMTLARTQRGLLTSRDLDRVTGRPDELRRRLRSGLWQEVLPGVIAPASVEPARSLVASAAMLWEPTALLSHHEAAAREGIWVPEAEHLRVTVPYESRRRSTARLEVVRTRHFPDDARSDGFHRWTPPARSVTDLAMVLTVNQLEAVLLSAVRKRATSPSEVEAVAALLPGRAGLADLRKVAALWRPERESLLEDRLFEDVSAVVREPVVRQLEIRTSAGRVTARLDVAVPDLRLAFEADGLLYHSTDEQIAADQQRDRQLLAIGWPTARFREDVLGKKDRPDVRRQVAAIADRRRRDLRAA